MRSAVLSSFFSLFDVGKMWALGLVLAVLALIVALKPKPLPPDGQSHPLGTAPSFKERFLDEAKKADLRGVSPLIALAIAGLETGWGSGGIFKKTNNLFNLKATSSWKGPVYPASDGGNFRVYSSWGECMKDWSLWFEKSKIFKNAFYHATANRAKETFVELQKGGYAGVDKDYAGKLQRTFERLV